MNNQTQGSRKESAVALFNGDRPDEAASTASKQGTNQTKAIEERLKEANSTEIIAKLATLLNDVAKEENFLYQLQEHHQEGIQYSINSGLRQLEAQANCINSISAQLEAEILKFAEIAAQVNQNYHRLQEQQELLKGKANGLDYCYRPLNIWEVHLAKVPKIVKSGCRFILTGNQLIFGPKNRGQESRDKREALEKFLQEQRRK